MNQLTSSPTTYFFTILTFLPDINSDYFTNIVHRRTCFWGSQVFDTSILDGLLPFNPLRVNTNIHSGYFDNSGDLVQGRIVWPNNSFAPFDHN